MSFNFDVVITGEDHTVDMNSGLETLKGASEATRQIATTLLEQKVPERLHSDGKVRTNLLKSFKGSYGQVYSLDIYDEQLKKRFNTIGKQAFTELMSYFISEALYQESLQLSDKAEKILEKLGQELEQKLIKQLQKSSLDHLHSVSNSFGRDVKLRYRASREKQTTLVNINRATHATLKTKTDDNTFDIIASITRLNINTGNGRLLLEGQEETVAFGFPAQKKYHGLKLNAKQKFSDNLHQNNGKDRDDWATLKLKVHTQKTHSGRIIKYLIQGIYDV